MKNDFILTQTKEVTMTMEKTVTVITETLEKVDAFGHKQLSGYRQSKNVEFHNNDFDIRRAA